MISELGRSRRYYIVNNNFYYEHIGHMQFSTLTLETIYSIIQRTEGRVNKYIQWNDVKNDVVRRGFSHRQVEGELDRFCYGFECRGQYIDERKMLSLTHVGKQFINSLLKEAKKQRNEIGIIIKPARRKNHFNLIIQESTFWPYEVYEKIHKYKFRKGPARDFLKCLAAEEIIKFLLEISNVLALDNIDEKPTSLPECLGLVEDYGKYWSAVGGKYSWFVFPQYFEIPSESNDWDNYQKIINMMIRPPEWGGGKAIDPETVSSMVGIERMGRFINKGIIRQLYSTDGTLLSCQLTALGYLMWERRFNGPICEIILRRLQRDSYNLLLCDATDLSYDTGSFNKLNGCPSWGLIAGREEIINRINSLINDDRKQLYIF